MRHGLVVVLVSAALIATAVVACGNKNNNGTPDAGYVDASHVCGTFGMTCAVDGDCCSNLCNASHTCDSSTTCSAAGTSCAVNTDCCSGSCLGNVCSNDQCVGDNAACTNDGQCCSGTCGSGKTCTPLNTACKSFGNTCANSTECCSKLCGTGGTCANGSYCVQDGDACAHDDDCCGGLCTKSGGTLGTCTHPSPGSTNCSDGVDGTVCTDCGQCCSRLCAPYGNSGIKICQPAEGCRIDGDLCQKDSDCCGGAGSGLPGDGHVICLRENPNDPVGVCRNPNGCDPEGDVCHFKDYNTCGNSNARNDCCGGQGNSGVCQLDALGVPRCYGLTTCRQAGETCSFSGDCCNGVPCVPDPNGVLRCGTSQCVMSGGSCSSTADCCNGLPCTFPAGSVQGTCGDVGTNCPQLGPDCSSANPCCAGLECNVAGSNPSMTCPDGQTTGCVCQVVVF